MSQSWKDGSGHSGQEDLKDSEDSNACHKSIFSGTSAPSNPVADMLWLDTANHIVKIRNETNNSWINVFNLNDFHYGCLREIRGHGIDVSGSMPSGKITLSLSDGSVTQTKLANYIAGDRLLTTMTGITSIGRAFSLRTEYAKISGSQLDKGGSLRVTFGLQSYMSNSPSITLHAQIFRSRDGILTPVGTQRSVSENEYATDFTEDIPEWEAGDIIEMHACVSRMPMEAELVNIYAPYTVSVGVCSIKTGNWYTLTPV